MNRVMVDIETLGLEPGAAIVSIGAVEFGPDGLGKGFYNSVDLASCQEAGLEIDAETLDWWLGLGDSVREQLDGGDDLEAVLTDLRRFIDGADEIWANSPAFDCAHLETAYDAVGLTEPWHYYECRDYRTIREVLGLEEGDRKRDGQEHHALDDAKLQARVAAQALRQLEVDDGE